jgi:pimeloyl-ACP methyl ester carboxylesterase
MKNIILLHGAIGAESQFGPLEAILESDFNVHKFNFYGHGGSPIERAYRIDEFADQLHDFIDVNKIDTPIIFGYSMGGMVALNMLSRYTNSVEHLITLGTKFGWTPEIAQHEIKMLNPSVIESKIPKFASILQERHAPEDWKKVLESTAEMMLFLGDNQPVNKETWSKISTPISVCLAENDEMVSQEETKVVYELLSNATFTLIPNSKHPIEQVDLDFLSEVVSGKL